MRHPTARALKSNTIGLSVVIKHRARMFAHPLCASTSAAVIDRAIRATAYMAALYFSGLVLLDSEH
jgi:hypothetical protein